MTSMTDWALTNQRFYLFWWKCLFSNLPTIFWICKMTAVFTMHEKELNLIARTEHYIHRLLNNFFPWNVCIDKKAILQLNDNTKQNYNTKTIKWINPVKQMVWFQVPSKGMNNQEMVHNQISKLTSNSTELVKIHRQNKANHWTQWYQFSTCPYTAQTYFRNPITTSKSQSSNWFLSKFERKLPVNSMAHSDGQNQTEAD